MGLFSGIFGTPQPVRNTTASGTKRSVFSSGKDTITLAKGEVVKGEITDLRSNEVTIRLEDGRQLHAKLSSAMELSIGQKAEFYVQETNDVLITLKLLADGDSSFTESAIDRALEAAGLPKSEAAAAVVRSLLTAGLPANKEMIQKMLQYSASNKGVELSTLTALLKHNLPVTKENAAELQAYRNFEHRLSGQASTLASALTGALQSGEVTPAFTGKLLSFLFPEGAPSGDGTEALSAADAGAQAGTASTEGLPASAEQGILPHPVTDGSVPPAPASETLPADFPNLTASHPANAGDNTAPVSEKGITPLPQQTAPSAFSGTPEVFEEHTPLKQFLSGAEYQKLGEALSRLSQDSPELQKLNQDFVSGTLTANKLFSALSAKSSPHSGADIAALFKDEPLFSSLLEKTLLGRFSLKPEDLTKEHAIKDFYEKTRATLSSLTELADTSGESSASMKLAADTGSKMQDNIQFMNTLNQLFPYVQLPLRLTEQLTHGELYVYTKKKDLSAQTKEVSILLHLDMDALGPTDIHLSLLRQNVTAKFYLTEQDAQELISEQLPSLTEALRQKGYTLNAQVMKREKEPDIVADFLDGGDAAPMKRFRFDIRA